MLAQSLCELATHVGLSQTEIARHLGVERANISYWARGHREVPEHHRAAMLALIFTKAKEVSKAKARAVRAKTLTPHQYSRFLRRLLLLVLACRAENMAAHELTDTASIENFLRQLEHFKGMPQEELCKPETAHKLSILSRALASLAMINEQHGPLLALAEELRHADTDAFEPEAVR